MAVQELDVNKAGDPDPIPGNPLQALISPYTWLATIHHLSGLFVVIPGFVVAVLMCSLWWPLLAAFVVPGVVAFFVLIGLVRVFGAVERWRFRMTLGVRMLPPAMPVWDGNVWNYFKAMVGNGALWRLVAYFFVQLPIASLSFGLTLGFWSGPIALMATP